MELDTGGPLAGNALAGAQVEYYHDFIIWDWDDWNAKGNTADELWITFKEGDEGFDDDYPLSGTIPKNTTTTIQSGYATAIAHTYAGDYGDDGDGIPAGVELVKFKTNPDAADSDSDGLTDADGSSDRQEVASGINPLVNEGAAVIPLLTLLVDETEEEQWLCKFMQPQPAWCQ